MLQLFVLFVSLSLLLCVVVGGVLFVSFLVLCVLKCLLPCSLSFVAVIGLLLFELMFVAFATVFVVVCVCVFVFWCAPTWATMSPSDDEHWDSFEG